MPFQTTIIDEHARFLAHIVDRDELELIEKAFRASNVFRQLSDDSVADTIGAHWPRNSEPSSTHWRSNREVDAAGGNGCSTLLRGAGDMDALAA